MTRPKEHVRIRFERKVKAGGIEDQIWDWLKDKYGRSAPEMLFKAAQMLYECRIHEENGEETKALASQRDGMAYFLAMLPGAASLLPHSALSSVAPPTPPPIAGIPAQIAAEINDLNEDY